MPPKYPKICPFCNHPKLFNLSDHLNKIHSINNQERKCWLSKAPYSTISSHTVHAHSSVPRSNSALAQFGNSLPKTSSLPEQRQLPNPASNENEDELIPCLYDSCISYERVWGTNVPVMDYDIFKLHHPFSMLVAGPRSAGKSEFVKQQTTLILEMLHHDGSSRENCLVLW